MADTIQESISLLHRALADYIEATYHIGDERLVQQRRALLDAIGNIHQRPYLESTPRYAGNRRYAEVAGLSPASIALFEALSDDAKGGRRIYDPPYGHQFDAIQAAGVNGKNLVIMTGTGSGKTESFLLPILTKLAREAEVSPKTFSTPAMRALLLYPMNALVNDQLGRLRGMFADARMHAYFAHQAGRIPRFARYTSRTPYAGVRDEKKDRRKLKSLSDFYVDIERAADGDPSAERDAARRVRGELQARGKWPAKPALAAWYGEPNSDWRDRKSKAFTRAIALPGDSELLTRHEVQTAPPDLLVTNYSMLEYMMMRPIERPIFEATKDWLRANTSEKFLVVLDEAHLYRGSSGAEVGLLLRRLRDRLEAPDDRFQVICATASFDDPDYAIEFGAQLSGTPVAHFAPAVRGDYAYRKHEGDGVEADARALTGVDVAQLHAGNEAERRAAVASFLRHRGISAEGPVERGLFEAFAQFGPLNRLVNATMGNACAVAGLGATLFPGVEKSLADQATSSLLALASKARPDPKSPGLLPARIHTFFRGLPGLWVCMDPDCAALAPEERSGICGKMYAQPLDACDCGCRVLEFFTCRNCGGAYARAYTDNVDEPSALWSMPGKSVRLAGGQAEELQALDLLLEQPNEKGITEEASYDLETGRLNAKVPGKERVVFLRRDRAAPPVDEDGNATGHEEDCGKFVPCALCDGRAGFNRSSVQDHQTKGDQPFQALISRQIEIQPPGPATDPGFAPLRGRKVLAFSDSRQVAARLAPNLQTYSIRDALRPLLVWGFRCLADEPRRERRMNLNDAFFAVVLASKCLQVRLRPALKDREPFPLDAILEAAVQNGVVDDTDAFEDLWLQERLSRPPASLLNDIVATLTDRFLGFESLAIASFRERPGKMADLLRDLPKIDGLAEDEASKIGVVRAWLRCWPKASYGIWFEGMDHEWKGKKVRGTVGKFATRMNRLLDTVAKRKAFNEQWLPILTRHLTDQDVAPRLVAKELALDFGPGWVRCPSCTSVHRPVPGHKGCLDCNSGAPVAIDPDENAVFVARKGYYREGVKKVLSTPPVAPMALIAAEHTAQLNAPQGADAFSKAEENEILFQDVDTAWRNGSRKQTAIDILSSTTTMEVGIDIGSLSGVALRNMPPGRANYQQRAGRAGRRGNAVATVVAFGSADSHDEHYFTNPADMISGRVIDPKLTLDNKEIALRHVLAFLLQHYHQERLKDADPAANADLFSVLGTVEAFRVGGSLLSRDDFAEWLKTNADMLRARIQTWIPSELSEADRNELLATLVGNALKAVDLAIGFGNAPEEPPPELEGDDPGDDDPSPDGEDRGERNPRQALLLERLLYSGVLPRYAFPTDVSTFHVFDKANSDKFRHLLHFAPSQSTPIALSQYAPGKQVWISGKCYTSGTIYSPMPAQRRQAWEGREVYFECQICHFADRNKDISTRGTIGDCPACKSAGTFGPGAVWMRPSGFAHPIDLEEETSPDSVPETSYATRAKLTMRGDQAGWRAINDRLRGLKQRTFLMVSNTGPDAEGYSYCVACGRIEATTQEAPKLYAPHPKPFPTNPGEETCLGSATARKIVLGTDFVTDVALFNMRLTLPIRLRPGAYETEVTLRTASEALAKAACLILEVEPGEILAEFRPGLSSGGSAGEEVEVFLYDTLAGGAGFSSQLVERGAELFRKAHELLTGCPGGCDSSCYKCLRSFKNKFEHRLLDRHMGAAFIAYLLEGKVPPFDAERTEKTTGILFKDLSRLGDDRVEFRASAEIDLPGGDKGTVPILATRLRDKETFAIGLAVGLTPEILSSPDLQTLRTKQTTVQVIAVNELQVRLNLPSATQFVMRTINL